MGKAKRCGRPNMPESSGFFTSHRISTAGKDMRSCVAVESAARSLAALHGRTLHGSIYTLIAHNAPLALTARCLRIATHSGY